MLLKPELDAEDIGALNRFAMAFGQLLREVRIDRYETPLNRSAEKAATVEHLRRGISYNPQFEYPRNDLDRERGAIEQLAAPVVPWFDDICSRELELLRGELAAAAAHSPTQITHASVARYGPPRSALVDDALKVLSAPSLDTGDDFNDVARTSSMAAAAEIQRVITELGLDGWTAVEVPDTPARMSVSGAEQIVRIRAGELFTRAELNRLLVHEIGTHVFRAVNGSRQPIQLLQFGLLDYQSTEEGLAVFHESERGLLRPADLQKYALRLVIADRALQGASFADLLTILLDYVAFDQAFDIAARAKRGFEDTAQPGCHVKDQVYFSGYRDVSRFLSRYPDSKKTLMMGKVSIDFVDWLESWRGRGVLRDPDLDVQRVDAAIRLTTSDGE